MEGFERLGQRDKERNFLRGDTTNIPSILLISIDRFPQLEELNLQLLYNAILNHHVSIYCVFILNT